MKALAHFIDEKTYLSTVQKHLYFVFNKDSRFPEFVFRKGFHVRAAMEFDILFVPEFWRLIRSLAAHFGDDQLWVMMSRPDPITYYLKEFGKVGGLMFSSRSTEEAYVSLVREAPKDSPADDLATVSSAVQVAGDSRNWGIVADRELQLAILATRSLGYPLPVIAGLEWLTLDAAIENLARPAFGRSQAFARFSRSFRENYTEHTEGV